MPSFDQLLMAAYVCDAAPTMCCPVVAFSSAQMQAAIFSCNALRSASFTLCLMGWCERCCQLAGEHRVVGAVGWRACHRGGSIASMAS
mmetsp:Transcript_10251/g.26652  ORF Transcript_10251/g.26652 Transcript_10251/m.26652 type:complete len:88 (-) Transcript_10251:2108-2371(-)